MYRRISNTQSWVQLDKENKCLKSKVGSMYIVGSKQRPSYSIRGAIQFGKSMLFSCLWQSVTHMVTIGIGVISSSHVDMVSEVVDIYGSTSPSTPLSPTSNIEELGSAAGVQPSDRQLHLSCCPAVYDSSENDHKTVTTNDSPSLRYRVQIERLQLQACNPRSFPCGAATANLIRLCDVPSRFFLIRQRHKGL